MFLNCNSFSILLEDSTDVQTSQPVASMIRAGERASIWCLRPETVLSRLSVDEHQQQADHPGLCSHRVIVEVQLTARFNGRFDYLLVEHMRTPNPLIKGDSRKESYELLAGVMPLWASFAPAWFSWVRDEGVLQSAVEFITASEPDAFGPVCKALMLKQKHLRAAAWLEVASVCFSNRGIKVDRDRLCGNKSLTAVLSMPMKIAQRMGGWTPPVEPPVFQSGKRRRRVLIADVQNYRQLRCETDAAAS